MFQQLVMDGGRVERDCTAHMSEVRSFDAQSLPGRRPS